MFFDDAASYCHFKPRALYTYMPIIPRLRLLYANRLYAEKMRYPKGLRDDPWTEDGGGIRDIWEGGMMRHWNEHGTTGLFRLIPRFL
jgi:hypothetical protein